ncbi:MAG: aminotransferase class I/II-fold pyridoxal phosphate-dependent enzyme [Candidatus Latescibacteria bacterium]|nr:aminotransferase class I/II-fold pyridoxal phosphate-dependent enzyme [Candidatus Latescibacterota bacterium]NIM66454.1 aminotransferase class I/II-fold pyridoxal phosphate-dependent enzyme [Candidatus Latescibacterota bacterium]NIO02934.1 aminotransferase class I/II-fold pyridoxal phosphate-dependent enzyme [Candidatus Latescibacterota bacterium]NIO30069.1 aminotransferase class I/II-fold pyridoxal phosphate-dependent enzyme [Candidatus Latescibacterota bacterium]NIO57684.1 aminotransferase
MSKFVDLRSDTVTRPVPEMRKAIAEAEVGDDVFGDDPTVNALEARVAGEFGREAALFVPSGTMANQVALAALTQPGDEVILDRQSHIFNYEVAAASAISGIQFNALDGDRGVITTRDIAPCIREPNVHCPETRVISLENTHNRAGGRIFPLEEMISIKALADRHHLKVHLDGARIANASVATGISFAAYASCADTVSMCFSKGLGAPIGSIVVSDHETIERARKKRKMFGGGMRQVGILAAAANYSLDHHVGRLRDDHENAARLGEIISSIDGMTLLYPVETNIVVFRLDERAYTLDGFLSSLKEHRVLAVPFGPRTVRMVTHLDVGADDISYVESVLRDLKPN